MTIRGLGPENYMERSMIDTVMSEAGLTRRNHLTSAIPPKTRFWNSLKLMKYFEVSDLF